MLIRNVKSNADLEKKKDLQSKLLQIAIDNEELLENRVKDYKNPNKPPPVPPQYKTNAEMQKDTTLQQKEVINNLLSINGVDNFIALGVSQQLGQLPNGIANYLIFNKNFPVIKKRLEDISKSAYGVDTFMNKIQEVLEQIEIGTLYNTTGGINSQSAFNQAIGAGNVIPSGQTLADFLQRGANSVYGNLLAKLYAIRDVPNSPLATDPDFIAMLRIYEDLMENSPNQFLLDDIDIIEQLERQKIQKEIDRLINIRGIPQTSRVVAFSDALDPNEYDAQVRQAFGTNQPPQLPDSFTRPYTELIKLIRNIKDPNITIPDIGKLKAKLIRLLGGSQAIQQGLQAQLLQAQQQNILTQQQAQQQAQQLALQARQQVIADTEAEFKRTQQSGARMRDRFVSNAQNPHTNQLYGNDMFNQSPTISLQPPDATNPADVVVEFINHPVYGIQELPFTTPQGDLIGIMDGNGAEITDQQGGQYFTKADFEQAHPTIIFDRYYYRSLIEIAPPPQQQVQAYQTYQAQLQAYQAQLQAIAGLGKKQQTNYFKQNPQIPQPQPVPQPVSPMRLIIGSANALRTHRGTYEAVILRQTPAQMKARSKLEIDALKQVLQTDPTYDPVNNAGQRLIQQQGYGINKILPRPQYSFSGQGFKDVMRERSEITNRAIAKPFVDAGNSVKGFFGGEVMCPAVYSPVMGKDGKMYNNKCQASVAGAGMKKADTIHIDINSHNGEGYKMSGDGFMHRKIKIGKGIEVQEQPRYKTFGKYIVHIPHLENDNILNFKFPSMGSIPTLKPVNVDNNFKEFILDILNTGKVNQRHYDGLTDAEKAHFNKVIKGAGLANTLEFKNDNNIDEKKDLKRLDILMGEIEAGNDNEKLKKECKELIKKCVMNGSIPKHKGMDYLFQIE